MNTKPSPPDADLDIRLLRYFVAVAEELHFTRAAARLFVAQQALSRDIGRLEARVGTPLFVRTTRRVTLTPEGRRLLDRARPLLALHDEIVVECDAAEADETARKLESAMVRAGEQLVTRVPIKVDVHVADEWCK